MSAIPHTHSIAIPTDRERSLAAASGQKLARFAESAGQPALIVIKEGKEQDSIYLPASALQLLVVILSQMAHGNAVTLMPVHAELTTQEASDLLNVSRPFFVKLLEEGHIPFRRVGTRRRVLVKDVLDYKEAIDDKRRKVLEELSNEAQKNNMGY